MCGIAGLTDIGNELNLQKADWEKVSALIRHRGPDAEGLFSENGTTFLHRRLSILDLSEQANQPMNSHCGRYVIVFNGEVYNFREIASTLKQEKPDFQEQTTSDTEIILEAFAHWGKVFVDKLNGMFAIAIYDRQVKKTFLFRDRAGIKPLFYFQEGSMLAFASELKVLKALLKKRCGGISKAAVTAFLHLGYIPEPLTIYTHVKKFPSGACAEFSDNDLKIEPYWSPEQKVTPEKLSDEKVAKQKLKELLNSSVEYRMISDVSFGTFLSGGIDSSLVTAIAAAQSKEKLNTFSIAFKEQTHNESAYSSAVAKKLGTNHHEFVVTQNDVLDLVERITDVYDEPYSDASAYPTMLVSKLAREHVTMTLSGDGGDELFMGYGAYKWASRLSNPFVKALRHPARAVLSMGNSRTKRVAHLFDFPEKRHMPSHIFAQEQYFFSRKEIRTLFTDGYFMEWEMDENFDNLPRKFDEIEQQALFDLKYYLRDDLLVKVDRASMQFSLETRVPILDYRIIEFALNLDASLKIRNGETKYLLKQVLYDYLPKELFDRPKWGFGIPLGQWMKDELRYLLDSYLNKETIEQYGIVHYAKVADLQKRFFNGEDYLYNRLWLMILLHKWLKQEGI